MKYDIVKVKITNRCNRKCEFCVFNNNDRDLSLEEFKSILSIIKQIDFKKFHINGGEPLINKDFVQMTKFAKKIFPDKTMVLGTNLVALNNNLDLLNFIKENYDEICIGCDLEHNNLKMLKKIIPILRKDSNIVIVTNSLIEYSNDELLNDLEKLKTQYNTIMVTNHIYHKCIGLPINKLSRGLCKQKNQNVILIQENGDVYRCFNCCIPEDREMNVYDVDFLDKISRRRQKHYKFCGWCSNYEP